MNYVYQQLIGGAWCDAANGGSKRVLNPATEEVVREVPYGSTEDCRLAIDAAQHAFSSWAGRTPYERGAILKRAADLIRARADALAHTTVLESGKPIAQARGEWLVSADLFEWFAEEGKRAYGRVVPSRIGSRRLTVLKQPIGVVGQRAKAQNERQLGLRSLGRSVFRFRMKPEAFKTKGGCVADRLWCGPTPGSLLALA